MGLSSAKAFSKASLPHGCQSTFNTAQQWWDRHGNRVLPSVIEYDCVEAVVDRRCVPDCADAAADTGTPRMRVCSCACDRLTQHELCLRKQIFVHTATFGVHNNDQTEELAVPESVQAHRRTSTVLADAAVAVQQT